MRKQNTDTFFGWFGNLFMVINPKNNHSLGCISARNLAYHTAGKAEILIHIEQMPYVNC
jgi:hypothetical protein